MSLLNEYFKLNNGVRIPKIGYGTWQIFDGPDAVEIFETAIKKGYRHLDTAALYDNEESVGKAIEKSDVDREDIFITSKVLSSIKTYEGTLEAFETTMEKLGFDYLDLYLIHGPTPMHDREGNYDKENIEVWRALEKLYKEGRIRAIGISNFRVHDMKNLMEHAEIKPMVNQIRFFVGNTKDDIVEYCKKHDILVEAYSPLGVGRLLDKPVLTEIGKTHNVTPAQVALRYCLQKGTLPLPKTKTPSRMDENARLEFTLTDDEMKRLDDIDDDLR